MRTKVDIYVFITINNQFLCWWSISPRGYHPPSSQYFGTDMVLLDIYNWNVQFLCNVIIIKAKVLLPLA